jgi:hypothetical protein
MESKEMEHSEPGQSDPPPPRIDEDGHDDPAIEGGWRRNTPPVDPDTQGSMSGWVSDDGEKIESPIEIGKDDDTSKGGNEVPEFSYVFSEPAARKLFKALDMDSNATDEQVVERIQVELGELAELKSKRSAVEQKKEFAERYPEYWADHERLMDRDRESTAKAFSDSIKTVRRTSGNLLRDTGNQLSPVALEQVQEVHKKFSTGEVTIEDFEKCIKTITNGGIIQFGEVGSSRDGDKDLLIPDFDPNTSGGRLAARKYFSEAVDKIQAENPDKPYKECVDLAAQKHPELAEAYAANVPG